MSELTVNDLEKLLRQNKVAICAETAERYRHTLASDHLRPHQTNWSTAGAEYTHDVIVVAAALHPSEITVRNQLRWASTGILRQHGIGYGHHVTMLNAYFAAARRVLPTTPDARQALDALEQFMARILAEISREETSD